MSKIKIVPCGTRVTIVNGNTEGTITASIIRYNSILYEITYFHQGDYKTTWCNEAEFVPLKRTNKIGVDYDTKM